jgi:CxxC motif-containing protein
MNEKHTLTCIGCPMSCHLELVIVDGEIREVIGNDCHRGEAYARQEYTAPCRMVSTTITCSSGLWPRLPVKTAAAVPKVKVMAVVQALHSLKIEAPVQIGQIILDDVAGTGIAVIATRSLHNAPSST